MQELIGRLTSLDPEATETLKVVTYFDALMAAGLGIDALARAAASMAGAPAGVVTMRRTSRFSATGERLVGVAPQLRIALSPGPGVEVWIEREGGSHVNDSMLLERFAFAVAFAARRESAARTAIDVIIDQSATLRERELALSRVGLAVETSIRVAVTPPQLTLAHPFATTSLTAAGLVSVYLLRVDENLDLTPQGVGDVRSAVDASPSFRAAELAYSLAGSALPVVRADDFGLLLLAADEMRRATPDHADLRSLARLDDRSRRVLDHLVEAESVGAAALALHAHHSTVQAHRERLTEHLGYDPRSAMGRARYTLARLALQLGPAREAFLP